MLRVAVDLAAPAAQLGGLLDAARPLPTGWERGVEIGTSQCVDSQAAPVCPTTPNTKTTEGPTSAEFDSFAVLAAVECSELGRDVGAMFATQSLDVVREYGVGLELAHAAVTGNPSLQDGTDIGPFADIIEAVCELDTAAAQTLQGRLAFIHMSPCDLATAVAARVVWRDGARWRTPSGNLIVSSPGYHGLTAIHATGEVYAMTGGRFVNEDTDRAVNTHHAYAEEIATVAFAPCFNVFGSIGV